MAIILLMHIINYNYAMILRKLKKKSLHLAHVLILIDVFNERKGSLIETRFDFVILT
jgi:hypothetical protein